MELEYKSVMSIIKLGTEAIQSTTLWTMDSEEAGLLTKEIYRDSQVGRWTSCH
jgi:hypothetical protein